MPLSTTSGAAKKRAKKAAAAVAAAPPSLLELIECALPNFVQRGQRSFYRSTLRAAVKALDKKVKPVRSFGDKDEWRAALAGLQDAGKLTYSAHNNTITMPEPQ